MEAEAMAAQGGWSSLPADLVNRVADCLLATNDLDYYMDLRGVCEHWRSSTTDPRSESNQHDPAFRPSRWVLLDEPKFFSTNSDDDTVLFVNTATGRFLRKSLLRPFLTVKATRSWTSFCPLETSVVPLPLPASGDMLAVLDGCGMFGILKLYSAGNVVERVTSIGGLALFLGVRCLAVVADCFPTIQPNCLYFQAFEDFPFFMYKIDIVGTLEEEQEPEFVGDAADYSYDVPFVNFGAYNSYCGPPFTVTQILFNYTVSVPRHLWKFED